MLERISYKIKLLEELNYIKEIEEEHIDNIKKVGKSALHLIKGAVEDHKLELSIRGPKVASADYQLYKSLYKGDKPEFDKAIDEHNKSLESEKEKAKNFFHKYKDSKFGKFASNIEQNKAVHGTELAKGDSKYSKEFKSFQKFANKSKELFDKRETNPNFNGRMMLLNRENGLPSDIAKSSANHIEALAAGNRIQKMIDDKNTPEDIKNHLREKQKVLDDYLEKNRNHIKDMHKRLHNHFIGKPTYYI